MSWCHLCRQVKVQKPLVQTPRRCVACGYERELAWMMDVYRFNNRHTPIALTEPEPWLFCGDVLAISDGEVSIETLRGMVRLKFCPVRFAP